MRKSGRFGKGDDIKLYKIQVGACLFDIMSCMIQDARQLVLVFRLLLLEPLVQTHRLHCDICIY